MLCSNFSLSVAISVGDTILLHTEDSLSQLVKMPAVTILTRFVVDFIGMTSRV